MKEENLKSMTDLVAMCKRRGFIFQSSEIYGGQGGFWDYGPLGVELKMNVKNRWWRSMTLQKNIVGLDSAIIMHPEVWKASGHIDGFIDPLVDCKTCKARFRADQIDLNVSCPNCGESGTFTEPRDFNLMFKTQIGPVEDSASAAYMRPETAQGIFVNFNTVQGTMRQKVPFGIAQIGKAFRNEITPGNFIFRQREFEQMEMQYFVKPGSQLEEMESWKEMRWNWHLSNGLRADHLKWEPHGPDNLAHYADAAIDIEFKFPHGWGEMEGIHSRTDFDLSQHEKFSGKNLNYVDQLDGNKKYLPYVIETSVGLDRTILALMCDAYRLENPGEKEKERVVMKFHPKIAPIKFAVMPLMKKPQLEELASKMFGDLQENFLGEYDVSGSIGKRYRRQDEIGTPYCLTVDFDSLDDHSVTVRDRDTMNQERISIDNVKSYLSQKL